MISIIIPVYNVEKYLAKCIDSVLLQDFEDWELLLINDGSTDCSGNICDEYAIKDSRIKVFHQENKGVSAARNLGIDNAQGEWITFIDSDDWCASNMLNSIIPTKKNEQIISENIHEYENCNISKLSHSFIKFNNENKVRQFSYNQFLHLYSYGFFKSPCGRLYNKEILTNNKLYFNTNLTYGEDLIFNLRYIKHINIIKISKECYYHYVHYSIDRTSSSVQYHASIIDTINTIFIIIHNKIKDENDWKYVSSEILDLYLFAFANFFHHNSPLSNCRIYKLISSICKSLNYNKVLFNGINNLNINWKLKQILSINNPLLIFLFYKIYSLK